MGMNSLRELYRIGMGPSSSHTMGPRRAAQLFLERNPGSKGFRVTLYGSLAATGRGHLTDRAILDVLGRHRTEIVWQPDQTLPLHPNGMLFETADPADSWRVYSIGGGTLWDGTQKEDGVSAYPWSSMDQILAHVQSRGQTLWEVVAQYEPPGIWDFLGEIWKAMKDAIQRGLMQEGPLPGELNLPRKASSYHAKARNARGIVHSLTLLFSYGLAVSEENAAGGIIVTAPTCGSAGVVPALLHFLQSTQAIEDTKILRSLATAGLVGNVIKTNASISGAEVGCQGEVGSACAMAAAAAAQLMGGSPRQVEYAAEIGLEHHLGLTCDPVAGLVQIPCIERNAMAAGRALECAAYALGSDGGHLISFDTVVRTMAQTGKDLQSCYKETSAGGLAYSYNAGKPVRSAAHEAPPS